MLSPLPLRIGMPPACFIFPWLRSHLGCICCNMPWSHSLLERERASIVAGTVRPVTLIGERDRHVRKLRCDLHEALRFICVYVPTHIPLLSVFGWLFYILMCWVFFSLKISISYLKTNLI